MSTFDLQHCFRSLTPRAQQIERSQPHWRVEQGKRAPLQSSAAKHKGLRGVTAASQTESSTRRSDLAAVIIVDHGSRRRESNEQLETFAEMYRRAHPERLVLAAHMELAEPSIREAMSECAKAGCSRVVVAPYFLSQGRHIQQDIPALVTEAQAAFPGVECTIAEPIGLDDAMVGIIGDRVMTALDKAALDDMNQLHHVAPPDDHLPLAGLATSGVLVKHIVLET